MRAFMIGIILSVTFILQSTIVQYIEVWHIKPNLVLIVILSFALIRGSVEGAVVGLCGGLLLDISGARVFGLNAFLGMYVAIGAGIFNKRFFKDNYFVAILFTFSFSFLYELIFYILRFYIWGETNIGYAISGIVFPESIYNCILAVPIYYFALRVNRWLEGKTEISRKY